jgi:hypothetical protein
VFNTRALMTATWIAFSAAVLCAQSNTGVISGQLRSSDGQPAKGVRVSAMEIPAAGAGAPTLLAGIAETDDSGRYRLADIPPGRYYITAGFVGLPDDSRSRMAFPFRGPANSRWWA